MSNLLTCISRSNLSTGFTVRVYGDLPGLICGPAKAGYRPLEDTEIIEFGGASLRMFTPRVYIKEFFFR